MTINIFLPNSKSAPGATAAAIVYLQFEKIFREIENLIEGFITFILKKTMNFKKLVQLNNNVRHFNPDHYETY